MAEQAQNAVHSVLGSVKFMGWEHQLENEPALQMALERRWKACRGAGAVGPGFSACVPCSLPPRASQSVSVPHKRPPDHPVLLLKRVVAKPSSPTPMVRSAVSCGQSTVGPAPFR